MSSHHFVKEGQEPALIIAEATAAPFEKIQELLEWSPTVIVMEPALPIVLSWGIKIDVAIVSLSTMETWKKTLHEQGPLKLLGHSDEEPIATAFYFLLASKQNSTYVVATWGSPLLSLIGQFQDRISVVIMAGKTRWTFFPSGKCNKWMPANAQIEIFIHPHEIDILVTEEEGMINIERSSPFWIGTEW